MENYGCSYPESGDSSPQSREVDFENPPPSWEEQPPLPGGFRVKFMVSYGGKIQPRPHDNQLSYVGGESKILAVDRSVKFATLASKLSTLCDGAEVTFKYQLPGEDLDALISVTNDDDLENMMHEYDRLHRGSSKPARLRLFLFTLGGSGKQGSAFGSGSSDARSDRDRFVDALNSGSVHPAAADSAALPATPPPVHVANNVDFLFELDKGVGLGVLPPPPIKPQDPIPDPEVRIGVAANIDEKLIASEAQIDARIQELNRLQIAAQEQQAMFRPKSDENLVSGFAGDPYVLKQPERIPPPTMPSSVAIPGNYWPQEKNILSAAYPATLGPDHQQQQQQYQQQQQQSVYMVPHPGNVYHAPVVRQMNGQTGQGYYQMQRMPPEMYREQAMYNMAPPPQPTKIATATYADGMGMQMRGVTSGVGMAETGYTQVAYDSVTGRQVYFTTTGGGVVTTSYQGVTAAAAAPVVTAATVNAGDVRPSGGLTAEAKVAKVSPAPAVM